MKKRNRTKSGLLIKKFIEYSDASLYTDENDHNPIVAADCPKCGGLGRWSEDDEDGSHHDYVCHVCRVTGAADVPAPLFDNDLPARETTADDKGWVRCPNCGKGFKLTDKHRWTGRRHTTCGQKLIVIIKTIEKE